MTEVAVERYLLDTSYDTLFEIFRRLRKSKLIEMSRLCSKFRNVAGDKRLWKNVCIKYARKRCFAFEQLYSEPWPVKKIDLRRTKIKAPVSSQSDQVIKVRKLDLTSITADKVTMEAILTKYQCTELDLGYNSVDGKGHVLGIDPEAFSKQTALEVLSLSSITLIRPPSKGTLQNLTGFHLHPWLAPVLSYCKNLKTLDLNYIGLTNYDMLGFVKNLPKALEKLHLAEALPEDSFFKSLAGSCPNLKVLELYSARVKCPSFVEFQFLEDLYITDFEDYSDLYRYLIMFPALKVVHFFGDERSFYPGSKTHLEKLVPMLEPHGIIVEFIKVADNDVNEYLWEVSKTA